MMHVMLLKQLIAFIQAEIFSVSSELQIKKKQKKICPEKHLQK